MKINALEIVQIGIVLSITGYTSTMTLPPQTAMWMSRSLSQPSLQAMPICNQSRQIFFAI